MGLGLGRIEKEFILKAVIDKEMPVQIYRAKIKVDARITAYDDESVTAESEESAWEGFNPEDKVSIFFSYFGHYMTFETEVLSVEMEKLHMQFPVGVYKNLQRKYVRVTPPEESKISFIMKGTKIELDFPKTEEFLAADIPQYSQSFNSTNITELISEFKMKVQEYISAHRIVMFREKTPESFEEQLISSLGRALFIPSTEGELLKDEPSAVCKTITKKSIEKYLEQSGVQPQNIPIRLSVLVSEKKNNHIHAEIWVPILYHEYAVGYVYVVNKGEKEEDFDVELLEYIDQFSKVLAHSLKISGYFKDVKPKDVNYEAKIIDISASGLLFSHTSKELASALMLYTDFEIFFEVGTKKMNIPVRVMRKFNDGEYDYYGVLFLDMNPEDFRYLFELVYGRAFTDEDESKWEGGAPPPEVDLFS